MLNAIERNVEALATYYKPPNFVNGRIFVGDGTDSAWTADDLNRIEQEISAVHTDFPKAYAAAPYSAQFNFYSGMLYI